MNIVDQIELCERHQDIADAHMEVCYDEADRATDPLWVDFNMVEGAIYYREAVCGHRLLGRCA